MSRLTSRTNEIRLARCHRCADHHEAGQHRGGLQHIDGVVQIEVALLPQACLGLGARDEDFQRVGLCGGLGGERGGLVTLPWRLQPGDRIKVTRGLFAGRGGLGQTSRERVLILLSPRSRSRCRRRMSRRVGSRRAGRTGRDAGRPSGTAR